jgi:hypothetical protein
MDDIHPVLTMGNHFGEKLGGAKQKWFFPNSGGENSWPLKWGIMKKNAFMGYFVVH